MAVSASLPSAHTLPVSLDLLLAVVEGATEPIAALDRTKRYLVCNQAYRQIFSESLRTDVRVGQALRDVLAAAPVEQARALNLCDRALAGTPVVVVTELGLDTGTRRRTYEVTHLPLRDPAGTVVGTMHLAHDVSERVAAMQAVRESEARFRRVVAHIRDALIMDYTNGRVVFANDQFLDLFGLDREDLDHFHLEDYVAPECVAELRARHDARIRGEAQAATFEYIGVRKDGSRIWVEVDVAPVCDETGRVVGTQSTLRDITGRKAQEEALRESERALREADRKKDEVLALIAHELRNPLTALRYAFPFLRHLHPTGGTARAVDVMERQTEQLSRIVDDLLDVGRIAVGKLALRREDLSLARIVHEAAESLAQTISNSGQSLAIVVASEPLCVHADPARLRQVITNLLHNACKFTPRGGHIAVESYRDNDMAVVRVRDDGVGFAPERATSLFAMFAQGESHEKRGGLGIGLCLVKRLVELHGGSVRAFSRGIGQGAEFEIRLPSLAAERGARCGDGTAMGAQSKNDALIP